MNNKWVKFAAERLLKCFKTGWSIGDSDDDDEIAYFSVCWKATQVAQL